MCVKNAFYIHFYWHVAVILCKISLYVYKLMLLLIVYQIK